MPPEDENNTPVDDSQELDTSTEVNQVDETQAEEVEQTTQEKALAAFDEGAAAVDYKPDSPRAKGKKDDEPGDEQEEPEHDPHVTETPEQKAEREKAEAEQAEKAEVDTAVKELGLKGKAEERFRDLTGRLKEATSKLEEIGGDEGLQTLVRDASDQREWDQKLSEIGCTPEQFGQAIGYIAAINSDDPAILTQARENLLKEVGLIDSRLGNKTDLYDPLSEHEDLQHKVDTGQLDEEDALEIARLRGVKAKTEQAQQQQQAGSAEQQQHQAGLAQLSALGDSLKARDGELFDTVMAGIGDDLNRMSSNMQPAAWKDFAAALYERELRAVKGSQQAASQARSPRPGVRQPLRQQYGTRGAATVTKEHTDPLAAFDAGVEEMRSIGR